MVYDISQRFNVSLRYFTVRILRRVRYVKYESDKLN